jgi:Common central domain of tyrosinase
VPSLATLAIGAATYLILRSRSESNHNLVHRWVNGTMILMTSPKNLVFWMHHAAIDRMWTIWQETHAAATPYQNTTGAAGHGLNDLIFDEPGDPAPWAMTMKPAIDGRATPLVADRRTERSSRGIRGPFQRRRDPLSTGGEPGPPLLRG